MFIYAYSNYISGVIKMKKIMVFSIFAVFVMIAISLTGVVGTQTGSDIAKGFSPLFGIRTNQAVNGKFQERFSNFIGERIFLKFSLFQMLSQNMNDNPPSYKCTSWPRIFSVCDCRA